MFGKDKDSWEFDDSFYQDTYQGSYDPDPQSDFGLQRTPSNPENNRETRKEKRARKKEERKARKLQKKAEKQQRKQERYESKYPAEHDLSLPGSFSDSSTPANTTNDPQNLSALMDSTRQKDEQQAALEQEKQFQQRRRSLFQRKKKTQQDPTKLSRNQELAMRQALGIEQEHGYDPGRMIEREEEDHPVSWGFFVGICILISIVGLGLFGYFETDFDEDGQAHLVSIERRYERRYVNQSDKLLQEMIDCVSFIENDTADMSDYVNKSSEIKRQNEHLKKSTDALSRYVDVPESMEAYHQKLLNVSLGIQQLHTDLLANAQNSDYLDWRRYSIAELNADMEALHDMRYQIDIRIWSTE